ncbi:hypothetical protein OPV22_007228 [Ensete ventricosum]|uniref:Cyclin-dependent kinase inhibitor n=1 Tax=Ensete ventricosum TaxID=4639 RepID=A0AAV8RN33_ENSVE|nr:hypothetical protein OPV22_007228 [Ensete ventricosum]
MEVAAHQPSRGVRTRARALAAAAAAAQDSSLAYLELRSRRLEKPLPLVPACKPKSNPSPKLTSQRANRSSVSNSRSAGSGRMRRCLDRGEGASPCVQVSFGENFLESESREREMTPCSSIRDSATAVTPGSTTTSSYSIAGHRRMQNLMPENFPTDREIEEFFVGLEKLQQQIFIEKYNYDPVNDHPLRGRYEWVEIDL